MKVWWMGKEIRGLVMDVHGWIRGFVQRLPTVEGKGHDGKMVDRGVGMFGVLDVASVEYR